MQERPIKILIIAEGFEEDAYLGRIIGFNYFSNKYTTDHINAKGLCNIFPRFQNEFQSTKWDLILIYCDGDNNSETFQKLLQKINNFFDIKSIARQLVFFANPCTMQIMLSHFADVTLTHKAKSENAEIIKKITDIVSYKASHKQIAGLMRKIKKNTYDEMKRRVANLDMDVRKIPSSNFYSLLINLESNDTEWASDLIKRLNNE